MGNLTEHAHRAIHELNEMMVGLSEMDEKLEFVQNNAKKLEQENEYMRQLIRKMDRQLHVYDNALHTILNNNSASAKGIATVALMKVRGNKV